MPLFGFEPIILLDLVEVTGVEPRAGEEVVNLRAEFFLEPAQVDAERVLAGQVVHAEEVIDSLRGQHLLQEAGLDAEVLPPDVPLANFFDWLVVPPGGVARDNLQAGVGAVKDDAAVSELVQAQAPKQFVFASFFGKASSDVDLPVSDTVSLLA